MIKLLFFVGVLFSFYAVSGQQIKEVSPGILGPRYEFEGDVFGGRLLEKTLRSHPEAHRYFKKSRWYGIAGVPVMSAGAILVGAGLTNVALGKGDPSSSAISKDERRMIRNGRWSIVGGLGLMAASIPLWVRAEKLKNKAIDTFNQAPANDLGEVDILLKIDQKGIGLVLVF